MSNELGEFLLNPSLHWVPKNLPESPEIHRKAYCDHLLMRHLNLELSQWTQDRNAIWQSGLGNLDLHVVSQPGIPRV